MYTLRYEGTRSGEKRSVITQLHEVLAFLARREASVENIEATIQRGMTLWNSIYEPHAAKLYNKLGALHPDFISTYSFPSSPWSYLSPPLPWMTIHLIASFT